MFRFVKMGETWYGWALADEIALEDDIENLFAFVEEGNPVVLVESPDELDLVIDLDGCDIQIVEAE